jgi:hypothetical protein
MGHDAAPLVAEFEAALGSVPDGAAALLLLHLRDAAIRTVGKTLSISDRLILNTLQATRLEVTALADRFRASTAVRTYSTEIPAEWLLRRPLPNPASSHDGKPPPFHGHAWDRPPRSVVENVSWPGNEPLLEPAWPPPSNCPYEASWLWSSRRERREGPATAARAERPRHGAHAAGVAQTLRSWCIARPGAGTHVVTVLPAGPDVWLVRLRAATSCSTGSPRSAIDAASLTRGTP